MLSSCSDLATDIPGYAISVIILFVVVFRLVLAVIAKGKFGAAIRGSRTSSDHVFPLHCVISSQWFGRLRAFTVRRLRVFRIEAVPTPEVNPCDEFHTPTDDRRILAKGAVLSWITLTSRTAGAKAKLTASIAEM
jgi:hypothetical protein